MFCIMSHKSPSKIQKAVTDKKFEDVILIDYDVVKENAASLKISEV